MAPDTAATGPAQFPVRFDNAKQADWHNRFCGGTNPKCPQCNRFAAILGQDVVAMQAENRAKTRA